MGLSVVPVNTNPKIREHWFGFGDSCVYVEECTSLSKERTKTVLFFLHGRLGHSELWHSVASGLLNHFGCYLVDLPGFGRSFYIQERGHSLKEMASLVLNILERFSRNQKVILVGHDIGGAIAQLCAVQFPHRIRGLILLNSICLSEGIQQSKIGYSLLKMRWKLRRLLRISKKMDFHLQLLVKRPWTRHSYRGAMIQAVRALEESWPGPFERRIWQHEIDQLTCPTLLLWGNQDSLLSSSKASELMRRIPDVHYYQSEHCGHWPHLEDPDWVITKIREFLFKIDLPEKEKINFSQKAL